jgi:hypothetical protein
MTVYDPYRHLVPGSLEALKRHWPLCPPPLVAHGDSRLRVRMKNALESLRSPYAIILHEDYRLNQDVKQDLLDTCLVLMRNDPAVLSVSLTYEPVAKTPYKDTPFQELPVNLTHWPYAIGFQARVWRVSTPHDRFEPECTKFFMQNMHPGWKVVTYPIPDPPKIDPYVDRMDKSEWIVGYLNVFHSGQKEHAC